MIIFFFSGEPNAQQNFAQGICLCKLQPENLNKAHPLITQELSPEIENGQALSENDKCIVKLELYLPSMFHPKGLGKKL